MVLACPRADGDGIAMLLVEAASVEPGCSRRPAQSASAAESHPRVGGASRACGDARVVFLREELPRAARHSHQRPSWSVRCLRDANAAELVPGPAGSLTRALVGRSAVDPRRRSSPPNALTAPTRTPTVSCASTSRGDPTSPRPLTLSSSDSNDSSTSSPARFSAGIRQRRASLALGQFVRGHRWCVSE